MLTLRVVAVDKTALDPLSASIQKQGPDPVWVGGILLHILLHTFLHVVSDAGHEPRMMSVRTALSAMWHQCKQLVGAVSCRQNNSLVDWVFTFHSAQVGMRLVWCLPSRWAGGGPA